MSGDRIRLGAWLRRLSHPRSWPVRWRLAAVSSGLTFVILVLFGGAIGQIATQRIRSDFNNEVRSSAEILAGETRVVYPLFRHAQGGKEARSSNLLSSRTMPRRGFSTSKAGRSRKAAAASLGPPQ